MSRQDELKKLISEHNRRLQKLKEQQARQGVSVDPKIPLEIEDIEAELVDLKAELEALPEIIHLRIPVLKLIPTILPISYTPREPPVNPKG